MNLFQIPPQTPYDLHFSIAGIPVRIHPLFWLMAVILGASGGDIVQIAIWVLVVFISILIHELGHSIAMGIYGQDSYIVLHVLGGLAVPGSSRSGRSSGAARSPGQNIFISFAGPLAGFLLAATVTAMVSTLGGTIHVNWFLGVIPFPSAVLPFGGFLAYSLVDTFIWVNVFWGLINLLPVFPLDGGNISRNLFMLADPFGGARKALWLSVIAGVIFALAGLLFFGSTYMAFLFGILAGQSYQAIQAGRPYLF
jgi:Zn-dependent protease